MMRGIRNWLPSAALMLGSAPIFAQAPSQEPAIAAALPGGTVVGSTQSSAPKVLPISTAEPIAPPKTPSAAAPIVPMAPKVDELPTAPKPPMSAGTAPPPVSPGLPADAPVNGLVPQPGVPLIGPAIPGNQCCGPVGANGPIGQEVYVRYGFTMPQGDDVLARNLKNGQMAQIGARTQLFDPSGQTAWVLDAHVVYAFNRGTNGDIITVEGEPVTIHSLHRTSVGLGLGHDWFFWRPGFILDTWDANFRLGADAGGRWGAGHVNFDTPFEEGGYRRRYDVFGQAFGGVTATMEIPAGGWIWLGGIRLEADYTFSDLTPKGGSFYQFSGMLNFGVRY